MGVPRHSIPPEAVSINKARLDHLASLDLPLDGKRVLDVGCGVGHHAKFYVDRGCEANCVDAREANIEALKLLHPELDAHTRDVERDDLSDLGRFDVVHCYGLLYHLENPMAALRNIAAVCDELMIIETIICDHPLPVLRIEDEYLSANQALHGVASRPSPAYIAMALNRIGFDHVYRCLTVPDHEDFHFPMISDLSSQRDGHNIRMVFVASRRSLASDRLAPMVRSS